MHVLLVITFRPEFPPPWTGHAGVTSITLSRLDRTEGVQLAGLLTTALSPGLLDRIVAQADGVPLFIEELIKAVMEGAVDTTSTLPTLGVPTTLQGSLLARLDRLPYAKQVAQIGSVLGREFSYELISAVSGLPEAVLAKGLDQLVSSGLAHCRGEPPSAIYRFKHALVQEAAYSTLLRNHRQQAHGRIADALSARSDIAPQVLAHHLTEAGRTREAVDHWFEAGQRVAGRSAEREAISLFRRGLSVLLTLPASEERDRRELEFQMALGMPLVATEGYGTDAVMSVYERVREIGSRLGDTQSRAHCHVWDIRKLRLPWRQSGCSIDFRAGEHPSLPAKAMQQVASFCTAWRGLLHSRRGNSKTPGEDWKRCSNSMIRRFTHLSLVGGVTTLGRRLWTTSRIYFGCWDIPIRLAV